MKSYIYQYWRTLIPVLTKLYTDIGKRPICFLGIQFHPYQYTILPILVSDSINTSIWFIPFKNCLGDESQAVSWRCLEPPHTLFWFNMHRNHCFLKKLIFPFNNFELISFRLSIFWSDSESFLQHLFGVCIIQNSVDIWKG